MLGGLELWAMYVAPGPTATCPAPYMDQDWGLKVAGLEHGGEGQGYGWWPEGRPGMCATCRLNPEL